MSSTLPPPPPPPSGPPPEYLESGGGAPAPQQPRGGSALRRGLLLGGGVVGLTAAGVGAWAAYSFFTTGAQPAEALPATTLGYVSVDLDPSGGQKIEALRTLNKFPAFKDYVGINGDDDLVKELFDRIQDEAQCDDLDYEDDIEPWIGKRAAFAAVDLGGDEPETTLVLQVTDADKADAGLQKIEDCDGGDGTGWAIEGDWAVIGESDSTAEKIVAATKKGSLADDADFKHWTDEAGDPGVLTAYASPAAGDWLADNSGFGLPGMMFGTSAECYADSSGYEACSPTDDQGTSDLSGGFEDQLRDFKGLAATLRFDHGSIELESAGDGAIAGQFLLSGGGTADVVTSLPGDTAAVYGLGFADGWFRKLVEQVAPYTGQSADELMAMLSDESGLDLPDDAEKALGDSAALSFGSDFDVDSFWDSPDGSDIPVAVKVEGDPDDVESVLDKLRDLAGPEAGVLASDTDGDTIVVGPNADYRAEVLKDGDLGDNEVFKDVIRESDKAGTILFVNVNSFENALADLMDDDEFSDNLRPVAGVGVTGWVDGDTAHAMLRLTTD